MKSPCAIVLSRFPIIDIWSHRLAWPRTEPSQGLNTGSNPVGTTTPSSLGPPSHHRLIVSIDGGEAPPVVFPLMSCSLGVCRSLIIGLL